MVNLPDPLSQIEIRNPATDALIKIVPCTPIEDFPALFQRAAGAQIVWSALSVSKRAECLIHFQQTLIHRAQDVIDTIVADNGKPAFEALTNEVLPVVDTVRFLVNRGPKVLRDKRIPLSLMKHKRSVLRPTPLGTVAVISPWNYPFLLPLGEILPALLAGNAVIFKPSEVTTLVGLKIQSLFDESGLPPFLFQTVVGGGAHGAELINQRPAKVFFTGSVATGKRVMRAASDLLVPVNLELGGKDAMVVLADADVDFATSAALWGGFSNSGQMCSSVERLIVHESIRDVFIQKLKDKLVRVPENNLGAITHEMQKTVYDRHLAQAKSGAQIEFLGGDGTFSQDRTRLRPCLVTGPSIENLDIYREETFGPIIAVTTFTSIADAVKKANDGPYGLNAYVFSKNIKLAESVANLLHAGSVLVNEVAYTAGLPETPWGGVKESGIGRSHSELGILECVHLKHIHLPRSNWLTFKSPWWFPYTPHQFAVFWEFLQSYQKGFVPKFQAICRMLWNSVQMLKKEPRL